MVLYDLLPMQAIVCHLLNSAIAKLKEKPHPECGYVRGFSFTSMVVSLTWWEITNLWKSSSMSVGTLRQESNVGGNGSKTTAHALFINLAYRMLLTFCYANLSQPTHPEILLRNTLTPSKLTPFLQPSLFEELLLTCQM